MKIGIFDSGIGGLVIAKALFKSLPGYDYVYLGDTAHLPYGNKTKAQIFKYTAKAVDFLFKLDCGLVIVACNTASALALRKIQQAFLPSKHPNKKVLGVLVPTVETIFQTQNNTLVGVIGTVATIKSNAYKKELMKLNPNARVLQRAAPGLVSHIELGNLQKAKIKLKYYLAELKKSRVDALILACTHYPVLKNAAKKIMGEKTRLISQDEIIPGKLKTYLKNHPEIENQLDKNGKRSFYLTSIGKSYTGTVRKLIGKQIHFKIAKF